MLTFSNVDTHFVLIFLREAENITAIQTIKPQGNEFRLAFL